MKKKFRMFKTLAILILIVFAINVFAQTPNNKPNDWNLIFEDHFDEGLDDDIWRLMDNYDHGGEPQIYTNRKKNVRVEDGILIIECHKENYKDHEYTSGYVDLRTDYKYGFFEVKCKHPLGKGLWPAYWLSSATSTDDGWPPEIDIFETNGKDNSFTSGGIFVIENELVTKTFEFKDYEQSIDEWHTYALEWTPEVLHWYVDDKIIATATNDIPHIVRRLVLNMALFPWDSPLEDADYFPAKFEIDYLKIWKRKSACPELSWKVNWTSKDNTQVSEWPLEPDDKYFAGDFTGNDMDEILFINPSSKKVNLFHFENKDWKDIKLKPRNIVRLEREIHPNDHYLIGDFHDDDRDELLVISGKDYGVTVYSYHMRKKKFIKEGRRIEQLPWKINVDDKYLVGDFNQDGKDEILMVSNTLKTSYFISYNEVLRQFESVGSSNQIPDWEIKSNDKYIVGDFYKDGQEEIVFINSESKKAKLYYFNIGKWNFDYDNKASGAIGNWKLNKDDIYISGDFDNNGSDDILCINIRTNYSRIYNPSNWIAYWTNHGNPNIYDWDIYLEKNDKMLCGNFELNSPSQIFVVRHSITKKKRISKYQSSFKSKSYEFIQCKQWSNKISSKPWATIKTGNPSGIIEVK